MNDCTDFFFDLFKRIHQGISHSPHRMTLDRGAPAETVYEWGHLRHIPAKMPSFLFAKENPPDPEWWREEYSMVLGFGVKSGRLVTWFHDTEVSLQIEDPEFESKVVGILQKADVTVDANWLTGGSEEQKSQWSLAAQQQAKAASELPPIPPPPSMEEILKRNPKLARMVEGHHAKLARHHAKLAGMTVTE